MILENSVPNPILYRILNQDLSKAYEKLVEELEDGNKQDIS
jgi:hypothetical protein